MEEKREQLFRYFFLESVRESQNAVGWKTPLEVILSNTPDQEGSARSGCPGPCPYDF